MEEEQRLNQLLAGQMRQETLVLREVIYEYPEIKRFSYLREVIAFLRVYLGILKRGEKCPG